ncbi:MAG: helix-turn-helix transcriptional regulator [Candidatus Kariarchaeaceae archaeon]|jgi:DNA-binding PadR family transcriptional regulator
MSSNKSEATNNLTETSFNSMFRVQTILLLKKNPKSGYELSTELEEIMGKRPSTGKIYPFLHELKDNGYIIEIPEKTGGRSKSTYKLTSKGQSLVDDLVGRMSNLLDVRLEQILDSCHHCGIKLYDTKVIKTDSDGREIKFCCTHCMGAFDEGHAH